MLMRPVQAFAYSVLLMCSATRVHCQSYTPYSYFQALSASNLGSVQVKLTYVGGLQDAPIATVLFAPPQNPTNVGLFAPYRHSGFDYGNDDAASKRFTVGVDELKQLIDSVATIPGVTNGPADTTGLVSFALMDTAGGTTRVFEAIPTVGDGRTMFAEILGALQTNGDAVWAIRDFGCTTELLPLTPPGSIASQVSVQFTGLRPLRSVKGRYVGRLRVTNTSATTIDAPIVAVAMMRGNAALRNQTGVTCRISPPGRPYVVLASVESLAPGRAIERLISFDNPTRNLLTVDFRVYGGPGMP
ncbi:MAG TPA: hypothetical protein VFK69_07045 [Candidatus Eisenbacteria bacterium]|nr:hypothetical protein [Candidatus Eisenbacteria bacterium]